MADQIIAVSSGFYDSIGSDRTYTAEDMNKPYSRILSDGVFADINGGANEDLKVIVASGMTILVQAGKAMCGQKWFENLSSITIVVPGNTDLYDRIDSVIMQVDTRITGRTGNIVYRTGTPAASPEPPAVNTISGVTEYRLANIAVASGASTISGNDIDDRRGTADCPWVASRIQPMDLPSQTGQDGKYLKTVGGAVTWGAVDAAPTSGSNNLITSGAVFAAIMGALNTPI